MKQSIFTLRQSPFKTIEQEAVSWKQQRLLTRAMDVLDRLSRSNWAFQRPPMQHLYGIRNIFYSVGA